MAPWGLASLVLMGSAQGAGRPVLCCRYRPRKAVEQPLIGCVHLIGGHPRPDGGRAMRGSNGFPQALDSDDRGKVPVCIGCLFSDDAQETRPEDGLLRQISALCVGGECTLNAYRSIRELGGNWHGDCI